MKTKRQPLSAEEQRRSDELVGACNTLKALHEHQGRLIAALDPRHQLPFGNRPVERTVLFKELFKQILTAAEGMRSIATGEFERWHQDAPATVQQRLDRLTKLQSACTPPVNGNPTVCACGSATGQPHAHACPVWQDIVLAEYERDDRRKDFS
jgi:hypothetical protein